MSDQSFPKTLRLLNSHDFKTVFDNAEIKVSNGEFLILACRSSHQFPRLGLVIAKKNIRLSVQRNRIKRIIREGFRKHQNTLGNIDLVVLTRHGIDRLENSELNTNLNKLWRKLANKVIK